MGLSEAEYEASIEGLKREKVDLEVQVNTLNERNRNQAMLLKRLESARQEERVEFEAHISELKNALSKERIRTRMSPKFRYSSLSPAASQRSLKNEEPDSTIPSTISLRLSQRSDGHNEHRLVSEDDKKIWKNSAGGVSLSSSFNLASTPNVQKVLLEAAVRKKGREEKRGGLFGLFGVAEEPDTESRNSSLVQEIEENRRSLLTTEIMQSLEENKRIIMDREAELLAREEVQKAEEEAIQKNEKSFSQLPIDKVNMSNISEIRDSESLDVATLRRLIADRTAGMSDDYFDEEGKEENRPGDDYDSSGNDSEDDESAPPHEPLKTEQRTSNGNARHALKAIDGV